MRGYGKARGAGMNHKVWSQLETLLWTRVQPNKNTGGCLWQQFPLCEHMVNCHLRRAHSCVHTQLQILVSKKEQEPGLLGKISDFRVVWKNTQKKSVVPKIMMGVSKVTGPKAGTRGATKSRGTGLWPRAGSDHPCPHPQEQVTRRKHSFSRQENPQGWGGDRTGSWLSPTPSTAGCRADVVILYCPRFCGSGVAPHGIAGMAQRGLDDPHASLQELGSWCGHRLGPLSMWPLVTQHSKPGFLPDRSCWEP